jgi:hypothetical protein
VSLTALLPEQLAPASTVTDELALGDADADVPLLALLAVDEAAGADELLPLLHAARPVTAASAATPPRVNRLAIRVVLLSDLLDNIGVTPLLACCRLRGIAVSPR